MMLNCFCFVVFTAVGKPLEELRKTTDLDELSELSDSIEERSKNKTAVSADQEVSCWGNGHGKGVRSLVIRSTTKRNPDLPDATGQTCEYGAQNEI